MTDDKKQSQGMDKRQMITAGVTAVILLVVVYNIYALFAGGSGGSATPPPRTPEEIAHAAQIKENMVQPKKTDLAKSPEMTEREKQLMQAQKMLQAKYAAALNELQMLKIQSDIAKTNNEIMKNRLDTIKSQKDIVDLLTKKPVTEEDYARTLGQSAPQAASSVPQSEMDTTPQSSSTPAIAVISVTKLHGEWNAVLGIKGKLYQVAIDDILPSNGMRVTAIDESGVVLQDQTGQTQKFSLVSII